MVFDLIPFNDKLYTYHFCYLIDFHYANDRFNHFAYFVNDFFNFRYAIFF